MALILAALLGAVIATIFSVIYHYFMHQVERRSDVAMDVVSWTDDVYDRLITIYAQRDAVFTGAKFGLSNDEYRATVKEVKAMLLASKMHTRVSLVYGKSPQLDKFDSLREEYISVAETLLEADAATWPKINQELTHRLNTVIEPLKQSTERYFLVGASPAAIISNFSRVNTVSRAYLPGPKEAINISDKSQAAPSTETNEQPFPFLGMVALIAILAFVFFWKPNHPTQVNNPSLSTTVLNEAQKPKIALYVTAPLYYGLSADDSGLIDNGVILNVPSNICELKLAVKNSSDAPITNSVLIIQLPEGCMPFRSDTWESSWQVIQSKTGYRIIYSMPEYISPGGSVGLVPAPVFLFQTTDSQNITYSLISDNMPPVKGSFSIHIKN